MRPHAACSFATPHDIALCRTAPTPAPANLPPSRCPTGVSSTIRTRYVHIPNTHRPQKSLDGHTGFTVRASRRPWQGGGTIKTIECGVRGARSLLRPKQALYLPPLFFLPSSKLLEQKFGTRCEAQPVLRFTPLYCMLTVNPYGDRYVPIGNIYTGTTFRGPGTNSKPPRIPRSDQVNCPTCEMGRILMIYLTFYIP